ncbi:unnamed protein product [Xylocopa violacea]|uniref:Uncharacterized protein n=1 Tax=Xylocopa violacea TaxID=135666 RepID=A0ABP1N9D7_XYLVO
MIFLPLLCRSCLYSNVVVGEQECEQWPAVKSRQRQGTVECASRDPRIFLLHDIHRRDPSNASLIEADHLAARIVGDESQTPILNMSFSRIVLVIVCVFVFSLHLCSTSSDSTATKKEKQFVPFHNKTSHNEHKQVKEGSFINVPINCPKGRVMIGDRCRATF